MTTSNLQKTVAGALALFGLALSSQAADFHVANAQDLQNALTQAAANGADQGNGQGSESFR